MSSLKKITINEVAREAGVSIATVSRFFNSPRSLVKEKRKKVEAAVRKLGYRPRIYARKLAGGKLGVFGLIIPGYEGVLNSFYALEIVRGMGLSLEKENDDLHIHIFLNRDRFNTSLVDGVLFADIIGNRSQLERFLDEKFPCVIINRREEGVDVDTVSIDNFRGAYQAVELLLKNGYKNIAHIAGDFRVQGASDRFDGYKAALMKYSKKVKDNHVKIANFSRVEARKAVIELFEGKDNPDAVFAASDDMAVEVISFAHKQGLRIPEDIGVVGFDDNPLCIYGDLGLTTVRQPLRQMASLGLDILRGKLAGETEIKRITLAPELVIRDTVSNR